MPSPLSLPPIAPAHQDDAVGDMTFKSTKPTPVKAPPQSPNTSTGNVALSFAFDIVTKSLQVVITDKTSGEVVRKIAYSHLPIDVHRSDQLHGLLLDQFA
jgi:hypothetical protein